VLVVVVIVLLPTPLYNLNQLQICKINKLNETWWLFMMQKTLILFDGLLYVTSRLVAAVLKVHAAFPEQTNFY